MTDTTPTTPLDLDAAVEVFIEAWNTKRIEIGRGISPAGTKTRAGLEAIGYAALVEEVNRLRGARELAEMYRQTLITRGENFDTCADNLAAERDAAIARAEAVEGERQDAMAKLKHMKTFGTVTLEITPDISRFMAATAEMARSMHAMRDQAMAGARAANRGIRQMQRNMLTGPLSDERREIQAIGRRQMAEAIAEFKASTKRRGWDCGCEALVVDAPAMAGYDTTDCVEHGRES